MNKVKILGPALMSLIILSPRANAWSSQIYQFSDADQMSQQLEMRKKQEDFLIRVLVEEKHGDVEHYLLKNKKEIYSKVLSYLISAEKKKENPEKAVKNLLSKLEEAAKTYADGVQSILNSEGRFDRIYFTLNQRQVSISREKLKVKILKYSAPVVYDKLRIDVELRFMRNPNLSSLRKDLQKALSTDDLKL